MKTSRLALRANPSGALRSRAITSASFAGILSFPPNYLILKRLVGALCLGAIALTATASAVGLKWNANPEPDIANYRVKYGTSPGSHPTAVDAGLNTRVSVNGLQEGFTYYFVVTAINAAGLESEPSDEVIYQMPMPPSGPVAASKSATTNEDTSVAVVLSATSGNAPSLSYTIVSGPTKGALSGTAPNLTYTPSADSNGVDSFTYKATDSIGVSNTATVTITVAAVNDGPVADSKSAATQEDLAVAIGLSGSDKDGQSLSYTIVSGPTKGSLSGTPPNLTYTPSAGFSGVDSFTYKADDSVTDSNIATVTITVAALHPNAPLAVSKSAATQEDVPAAIVLAASTTSGQPLSYAIVSGPAKGSLSGTPPNLTYTPSADFNGSDSFVYKANDTVADSNYAMVSISVSPVNDKPVAVSKSVVTNENTPLAIVLGATDNDGDTLSYSIVSGPATGILAGNAPNLTYTPSKSFSGNDSITFRVSDGTVNSLTATVSIEVKDSIPVVDPNVISRDGWTLHFVDNEDASANPAVNAFDGNRDTFWHTRLDTGATPPPHDIQINLGKIHTLHGFRYLPRQDGSPDGNIGQYEFYTSMDGINWGLPVASGSFANSRDEKEALFSAVNGRFIRLVSLAEVSGAMHCNVAELDLLGAIAANQVPVADSKDLTTTEKVPLAIKLTGSDADLDALTFSIISGPGNGTLAGAGADLTYFPRAKFIGVDSFTIRASDGRSVSNIATVSITVTANKPARTNRTPSFKTSQIAFVGGSEGELAPTASITDTATDPDEGDTITYSKVSGPEWLEIAVDGKLTGVPPKGSRGIHQFNVRATDSVGAFAESLLLLEIEAADLPLPWSVDLMGGADPKYPATQKKGSLILKGSGALAGPSDAGTFVSQTLSGDGEIIACVDSVKGGGKDARAGVMIRDSLAPNSKQVFVGVDGTKEFRLVSRTRTGKAAVTKAKDHEKTRHIWVRLVRKGDTIISFTSADGSDWSRVGAANVNFGRNCYIGLAVSGGKGNIGTAEFRNVKVKN